MTSLPALRVQVVLYGHPLSGIWRLVSAVAASARHAQAAKRVGDVTLAFGDCSRRPVLNEADLESIRASGAAATFRSFSYEFFDANLGSAGGSNSLAADADEEFLLVLNPDTYPSPMLLTDLISVFEDPTVGAADARQLPLEHPKEFDLATGDTSWVSGSCMLVRSDVFEVVGGFDTEHFFLYCDDVDFSWRVRLRGFRTVHVPKAVVFHDKRIDNEGRVAPTALEGYHGLLGRLMLATRYGRPDLVEEALAVLEQAGLDGPRDVLSEWERRVDAGAIPSPIEGGGTVAQFVEGEYARHRF